MEKEVVNMEYMTDDIFIMDLELNESRLDLPEYVK